MSGHRGGGGAHETGAGRATGRDGARSTGMIFQVVLHRPEIPNNTGNIGRTCVATACGLHLVHPLGFDTSEKACRRAGLDYWPRLHVREHADYAAYVRDAEPARMWVFASEGERSYFDEKFEIGDHLVFGSETSGFDDAFLAAHRGRVLRMPMVEGERSLNLATAVCAVVYEGIRQLATDGRVRIDDKGILIPPG